MTLTAKMASTLRNLTRGGREETFSTTLVEDLYSRPLRALVEAGVLTMDYTGTHRVYTLTPTGRTYLEGRKMGKRKQPSTNGTTKSMDVKERPALAVEQNGHPGRKKRARIAVPTAHAAEPPKKPRAQPAPPARPAKEPPRKAGGAVTPVDVIRLMRDVRDYADAHEGVDELLVLIRRIEELGHRFGGLDCVRESLEAIKEFREEKTPR